MVSNLAVGALEGSIEIWDAKTSKVVRTMRGHSDRVPVLGWNGHILASGCRSGQVGLTRHQFVPWHPSCVFWQLVPQVSIRSNLTYIGYKKLHSLRPNLGANPWDPRVVSEALWLFSEWNWMNQNLTRMCIPRPRYCKLEITILASWLSCSRQYLI